MRRAVARTGVLTGNSLLVEGLLGSRPFDAQAYGSGRLDFSKYVPIAGSANFFLRGGAGTSVGSLAQGFYLSSFDTLRGVYPGDPEFLLGRHFAFSTAELQIPLDLFLRVLFLSNLEGIVALDAGSVSDEATELWDHRVLDAVVGGNVILGPLMFRIHFARPLDVGAPLPTGEEPVWVTNLSLAWLYG
jgi:hypothetical protein